MFIKNPAFGLIQSAVVSLFVSAMFLLFVQKGHMGTLWCYKNTLHILPLSFLCILDIISIYVYLQMYIEFGDNGARSWYHKCSVCSLSSIDESNLSSR